MDRSLPDYQRLSSFRLPGGFRGRSAVAVQVWWLVQDTLFRWSPQFMFSWRVALLRAFGAKIGVGVKIRSTVRVTYPWNLTVGDNVWIGDDCVLYDLGKISIGSDVALAHGVYLCCGSHDYRVSHFPIIAMDITVEDQVWLPNEVFVGPGVTIGRGCVVGARSTVLSSMPAGMICVGTPAKPVRRRPHA
jgi:putative colanic acid biosynthesis acetyltransferase WcaF